MTLYTPDLDLGRNWPISQSGRSFLYCLSIWYIWCDIAPMSRDNKHLSEAIHHESKKGDTTLVHIFAKYW